MPIHLVIKYVSTAHYVPADFSRSCGYSGEQTNQIPAYLMETDDKYTSNISGGKCYGEKLSRAMGLGGMGRRLYECVIE